MIMPGSEEIIDSLYTPKERLQTNVWKMPWKSATEAVTARAVIMTVIHLKVNNRLSINMLNYMSLLLFETD